ncbi:MAG TPA: hypothetical protein VK101_08410 [Limnochordia bacterium]|nr:hypothetical protein [Limnochordia bacterium]
MLLLAALAALGEPGSAQSSPVAGAPAGRLTRVAIAEFALLDEQGEAVLRPQAPDADLARMTRLVPAAIGARLVQSAEYDVVELGQGVRPFAEPADDGATAVPREVASWLARGVADEIITGAAGMLQTSVVVTAQRYGLRNGEPALIGAAAIAAPRVTDVMSLVDSLVEDLFSAEAEIIVRPIEQLFIIPSTLRLPMGRQGQLQAFAVDAMGRPVSKVEYLFQSSDTALLEVDENGRVTGIAPGQAVVTVRAVGRPTRVGSATATVQVVPPSFGLRAGVVVSGRDITFGRVPRLGLRLTPTVDVRPRPAQQRQSADELERAASNPLSYLTNLFSSLLSDGLFTIEIDIEPNEAMLFTLDAIQRTRGGFFGTGIGFASPLRDGGPQGVSLRLTVGTQLDLFGRTTLPFEVNTDVIFSTGQEGGTQVRVGVATGFDLFQ